MNRYLLNNGSLPVPPRDWAREKRRVLLDASANASGVDGRRRGGGGGGSGNANALASDLYGHTFRCLYPSTTTTSAEGYNALAVAKFNAARSKVGGAKGKKINTNTGGGTYIRLQ